MSHVTSFQEGISRRRFLKTVGVGLGTWALAPVLGFTQESSPTIKIGVLAPLIFNFPIGQATVRGAFLAQDEINAQGGILGRTITVEGLIRDTQFDPRIAPQRFEELATQQKVLAIVGGFLDETTLPVMSVLPRVRTPFLNTGTATPETTTMVKEDYANFKFYFRLMLDTDVLTEDTVGMAEGVLAKELGISKAAVIAEDGGFGRDFQSFLEQKLPEVGIEVPEGASFRFPQTGNFDFSGVLSQAQQAGAEAFLVAIIRNNGFAFVRQWFDLGPRLPVAGINVSGQAFEYFNDTQGKVISHTYADAATGATAVTERTLPFFNAYVQRFTTPPVQPLFTSYTTYDALFVLKQAIERIGGPPPDPADAAAYSGYREQLVEAIEQTDWIGTVGRIRFQGKDDPRPHDPITRDPKTNEVMIVPKWVQWQVDEEGNPDRKVVWPPEFKNSEFIRPPA
jgi:branched-chain amino acid transport system substrate-binding protein